MKKKFWKITLGTLIVLLVGADLGGAYYLFNFAFKKGGYSSRGSDASETSTQRWARQQKQERWTQTSFDGLKMKARYYPAPQPTKKTIVVVHGYGDNSLTVGQYSQLFHEAGYNVLTPDGRAAGMSQGKYLGYGWQDRDDLAWWIKQVQKRQGPQGEIGLYGLSMGAAEVMYYLGLKVPKQVKFAITDCGYASIKGELQHELQSLFHLPSFPLLPTANLFAKTIAHYDFYAADTKKTLRQNRIPLFIIHGTKDDFVPTKHARINYDNNHGPKKLWLVSGAKHAQSYQMQPQKYRQKVIQWTQKYFQNEVKNHGTN
ncbi:alpha/beta hydrolase [Lactobacillus sp. DCY120]|uniref:Alpha/beta hydrolase n=1 Tax=Bombilactobacillus apium TaxID=2675299 RepID=A0A850QX92_9LACO|nr:alpha/beta hydrolase [Bombilactobacillus apium]NVY96434.1 alpha/beta hydrolase [Bombilactobacillus apium]